MTYDEDFEEGVKALQEHNLATAYRLFQDCTKNNPDDYNAFLYYGIVLNEMGEYKDALAAFKRCIWIDENLPHAYANMGIVYTRMNNLDEALRHFFKATQLDPTDINARLNLGIAYWKTRNKELNALQEFKYVLEHDDTIPDAWHYLGLIFMDMQKKEFALYSFLKAKELGFDDAEKNDELIRDIKFDGFVARNPLDAVFNDIAFLAKKKDVSKR
jgi:tetratricopeptide (TPR) repeat protein